MGYCPRCGENAPFGESEPKSAGRQPARLRIPRGTRIVALGDRPDGEVVTYGGSRFRIRLRDDAMVLELVD